MCVSGSTSRENNCLFEVCFVLVLLKQLSWKRQDTIKCLYKHSQGYCKGIFVRDFRGF